MTLVTTLQLDLAAAGGLNNVTVTVRTSDGALLTNTLVRYVILKYAGGVVADPDWMDLIETGTATTNGSGVLDVEVDLTVGTTVYLAVFEPSADPAESMIWTASVA